MQIIIDIPKDDYYDILQYAELKVNTEFENLMIVAIKKGTPLPKGHGDLIDVNDLLDRIGLEDNDSNREENVGEIITLEDFDFIPTIIEADAESEDKE